MHNRQYNIPARLSMEVDEEDVWTAIISTSSLAASADRRNPGTSSSISDTGTGNTVTVTQAVTVTDSESPVGYLRLSYLFASDQHGQRKIPDFLSSRRDNLAL